MTFRYNEAEIVRVPKLNAIEGRILALEGDALTGRVIFSASTAIDGVATVTTEAMLPMVAVRDGVAAPAATSFTVTAGKRLRISLVNAGLTNTAAGTLSVRVVLHYSATGPVTAASPTLTLCDLHSGGGSAQQGDHEDIIIPDGAEFTGDMQIGMSQVASDTTGIVRASVVGFEY